MGGLLTIRLEVYLPFRGERRWSGRESLPVGTQVGQILGLLGLAEPELAILVNGRYAPPTTPLQAGDEVAILRQSDGG